MILSTCQHIGEFRIFSDCQGALLTFSTSERSKNYTELTLQTGRNLQTKLVEKGTSTIATWVCGHAEIQENDLADTYAKIAATEASFLASNQVPISLSEAKAAIKKCTLHLWQISWSNNNPGCHLYDLQPMVSMKAYRSLYRMKAESKVNRLKMGHSLLNQHLHRIAMFDNPTCDCGTDR